MIDITPKALRFARLAAEEQPSLASDPQLSTIVRQERDFSASLDGSQPNRPRYIQISEDTAAFCLRAIGALLQKQPPSSRWDGNDVAFMNEFAKTLSQHLSRQPLGL